MEVDYSKYVFDKYDFLTKKEKQNLAMLLEEGKEGTKTFQAVLMGKFESNHSLIKAMVAKLAYEPDTGTNYAQVDEKYFLAKENLVVGRVIDEEIATRVMEGIDAVNRDENARICDAIAKKQMFRVELYERPFDIMQTALPVRDNIGAYCIFSNSYGIVSASTQPIEVDNENNSFNVIKDKIITQDIDVYYKSGGCKTQDIFETSKFSYDVPVYKINAEHDNFLREINDGSKMSRDDSGIDFDIEREM